MISAAPTVPTISVVDDEESVRKALTRLLRVAGFNVGTFASGLEFLKSLRSGRPDCVILDIHLPEVSGLDVQEKLGREEPTLPVIAVTGRDEPGLRGRLLQAGAAAYLVKPLDAGILLDAVALAVGKCRSQKPVAAGESPTIASEPLAEHGPVI